MADQHVGPFAVPVVLADKPAGRHASDAFDAVQVVQQVALATLAAASAGIRVYREISLQPAQAILDGFVGLLIAAALDLPVDDFGIAAVQLARGDD